MSEQKQSSCCSKPDSTQKLVQIDPVCGMQVELGSSHFVDLDDTRYLFCCDGCKQRFIHDPAQYLNPQKSKHSPISSCCGSSNLDSKPDTKLHSFEAMVEPTSTTIPIESGNVSSTDAIPYIDPVCGMTVHDLSKPHTRYQNQLYYFCGQGCLNAFNQDPKRYLLQQSAELKPSCCAPTADIETSDIKKNEMGQPLIHTEKSCCGGHSNQDRHQTEKTAVDPVCGMSVKMTTDLKTDYQDQSYYFCNPSCLAKFKQDPETYLIPVDQRIQPEGMDDVLFTCPMDPEIVQKGPGTCPICGMALEPMQPSLDDGPNPELVDFSHRFWMTLPLTLLVFILAMGSHIHAFIPQHIQPWIELVLSLPVVLWAGKPFIERCFTSYRTRNLNMWSLIGVGILAAFIYSVVATIFPSLIPIEAKTGHGVAVYFEAACMIVSLSLLGQIMELKARAKTADSLKSLLKLQPTTAKRIEHGLAVEVDIAQIQQGDVLQIASGEQIPLDGIVIEGKTYIDEAMMTGEPLPVKKEMNDSVIGGTVNQQGSIRIRTTAIGQNTTLAKMIQTVADAQRSKAPLQRMADVVAKYFVMIVLSISVLTFIAWMLLGHAHFDLALMCAVAVLIIACPCALGLATPMSVMATTGRAAQKGVLFKDAEAIEALSKVNTLIIDKTGTLTEGKPSLKEIKLLVPELDQRQIEIWIASIEQYSTHPIAQTLAKIVPAQSYVQVDEFEEVSGFGVRGQVDGFDMYVGSQKLIEQLGLSLDQAVLDELDQQRRSGNVISFLAHDQKVLAYISIHDAIKHNAQQVIRQLQADGIEVVMATGDHSQNAQLVANELGIQQVYGNCTPTEKLDIVKKYQAMGKVVVMAGDGINDAPALAQANIGIAMGNGTDIAKQTAQITLVKGDVRGVADAIHMAKLGVKNMKQNLAFSFVYNGLGVPVAAGIFYPLTGLLLTPMIAAIAMSLSSLSVVVNALRLNKS